MCVFSSRRRVINQGRYGVVLGLDRSLTELRLYVCSFLQIEIEKWVLESP